MAIAAGDTHTLALRADGTVVAWGLNAQGQSQVPPSLTHVVAIAAGYNHNLAIVSNDPALSATPTLRNFLLTNQTLSVALPTLRGRSYFLEFNDTLKDADWIMSHPVPSGSSIKTFLLPVGPAAQRFYRIRKL